MTIYFQRGECLIEYIEGFFSIILGIIGGIFIGIGFLIAAIFKILRWIIVNLIGLCIPSLRYKLKLNRMIGKADNKKDAKLRTGMLSSYEMTGSGLDALFTGMKSCIETYNAQKRHRPALKSKHPELGPVFKQYDELFEGFQKQFYLSADKIDWKKVDVYNYDKLPAYPVLQKALAGMKGLVARQQAVIDGTVADELEELEIMQSVTESVMLPPEMNEPQQTQQMQ